MLQNWFQTRVRVQPGRARRAQQQRHRGVPPPARRLLRAVRRHVRGDGPVARTSRRGSPSGTHPGFDQGDGTRSVLGRNSHAWPEVWFDGLGWVPFEPTPGRGAPGAEGHTGLAGEPGRGRPRHRRAADEGDGPPATAAPAPAEPTADRRSRVGGSDGDTGRTARQHDGPHRRPAVGGDRRSSRCSLVALVVLPELVRRWRRHHPSADVAKQMGGLWRRALGALEATGCASIPR